MGNGAIVAADRQVFILDRRSPRVPGRSGPATPWPRSTGAGVWLLQRGRRCALREVGLDSLARRPPRRVPCTIGLLADTPLGLLVWTEPAADGEKSALLDPGTGRVVARYPEVLGVVGDLVLWGDQERGAGPFTLTNRRTGARHRVPRPTPHGLAAAPTAGCWPSSSSTCRGPACRARWTTLAAGPPDPPLAAPAGTPLITGVKFMSMQWTADGRLVLAGDFERFGEAVVVWRPGQDHLAIKRLDLPDYAGSDTFVAFPAPGS